MSEYSIRFGLLLLISAILYVGTIAANCVFMTSNTLHGDLKGWFLPCIGLLLLPSVILQLVSAIMLLLEKGDKLSVTSSVAIAVLHIFQLGFLWRHVTLFREIEPSSRLRGQTDMKYLQILFAFTTSIPLVCIHSFIFFHYRENDPILLVAMAITFISSCWFIASFRKSTRDEEADSWTRMLPGKICRLLWRFGELASRLISLVVFTSVYYYWIFLILGLHGITMLVCLCTTVLGMFEKPSGSKSYKVLTGLLLAYMYSFCFINLSSDNAVFRYSIYYIIMFLENGVLTLVWFIHEDQSDVLIPKAAIVIASACAFFIGIISLIVCYNCFNAVSLFDPEKEHIYESETCINCKLSVCSKHCIKLQRPFSAGWISQYKKATSNGQYYKNILHDTLLDSELDTTADMLNSSGEHWQIRDTDLESIKSVEKKQYTSVQGSGTYTHKRFFDSDSSIAKMSDTDSITSETGSGAYDEDWRKKSDTILSQLSAMDALSLVSSNTRLLTDSWDNLIKENKETVDSNIKQPKKIDILNSLIRKDLDSSFVSDGYITDHTLDSYQLPVTVLAKKRLIERRKAEPAYSTASDSTDCTICAFMRHNQSSPESSRKSVDIYDSVLEDTHLRMIKKKKRDYMSAKRANRHRRTSKKPQQETVYVHRSNPHMYEKSASCQRRRELIRISDNTSKTNPGTYSSVVMPYSKRRSTQKQSDNTSSGVDTSLDEYCSVQNVHKHRVMVSSEIPHINFDKTHLSTSMSDSGDSAFPRNTPVSDVNDVSDVTDTCCRHNDVDSLYSKVIRKQNRKVQMKKTVQPPQEVTKICSSDSTGTRNKILTAYLATTAENDGTSESSCEMII